ncbi:MAG: cytochrome c biogenesis protein CcdA [Gammaproteobacteria bacterium]
MTTVADTAALAAPAAAAPPQSTAGAVAEPTVAEQDQIAAMLAGGNTWLIIGSFFLIGLLLAFTPCVFPMIPILSGIIAGQGSQLTTRKAFVLSLVYVLAMAVTYTVAGVLAGLFGSNLQAAFQNPWILGVFALVFVALALSMFGFYELQLPSSLQSRLSELSNRQEGGKLTGVAIMGLLSALIVGPCVAPPLAGALIYIGQTGDAVLGGLACAQGPGWMPSRACSACSCSGWRSTCSSACCRRRQPCCCGAAC